MKKKNTNERLKIRAVRKVSSKRFHVGRNLNKVRG